MTGVFAERLITDMKKIAIITIIDNNYGNRLQNYAAQEILKKHSLYPETIRLSNNLIDDIKHSVRNVIKKDRYTSFRIFDKNIKWSKFCFANDFSSKYDYFSIGSDQVWNAEWFDTSDYKKNMFLLSFAKPEQRICMSPSFGLTELPEKWKPWFKEQLSKYNHISVREEAGAEIVEQLTGKKASVLIDPTLMLDTNEWDKVSAKPKGIDTDSPYLLTYFLGEKNERVQKDIKEYSAKNNLKVYNLQDISDNRMYSMGPAEFIYLISKAKLVVTDSFHACVFSFLYKKPFVVYARNWKGSNMMSRLDTLLSKFDLKRKYIDSGLSNDLMECDYENGYRVLKQEREKFDKFMKESFNQ